MTRDMTVPGDMDPDDFRRNGRQVVDWIGDYLEGKGLDERAVFPPVQPGEILAHLPTSPPRRPEPMEAILGDFRDVIVPGLTHWNDPRYFAYFPISPSAPAILGDALAASLGTNAMLWRTSPAATELEQRVTDWLRQMLGLPETFRGTISDSASIATLSAIAAAREKAGVLDVKGEGLGGRPGVPRLRLYTSDQAHSSVDKAAAILGIGTNNVRKVATDGHFRMIPRELDRLIREDLDQGYLPFCVVATAGTTSSASIDPLDQVAAVSRRYGLWLHVDGAYGVMACIMPEFREAFRGLEAADSVVTNPHKWLFCPLATSALFVADAGALTRAFRVTPDYLQTPEADATNYSDWGPHLSRGFRALKLWMTIRYFGQDGLARRLREHVRLAGQFASWVEASPDFELMAPASLATVCFRANPPTHDAEDLDALNEAIMAEVNRSGEAFLSHTRLRGRFTLRMSIGNIRTQDQHVAHAWDLLQEALRHLWSRRPNSVRVAPATAADADRVAGPPEPPAPGRGRAGRQVGAA